MSFRLSSYWILGVGAVAALLVLAVFLRPGPGPSIELLALGARGLFQDTVALPPEWGDRDTRSQDAVIRFPLILGVRNTGDQAAAPDRVTLRAPTAYRLVGPAGDTLASTLDEGSALRSYALHPGFTAIEPARIPDLLPAHDTLWLEVVVPSYYCVAADDSVPEFVRAPRPDFGALAVVRLIYAFEGGDLERRQTGTLVVGLDAATLARDTPPEIPDYPAVVDPVRARPRLGPLRRIGARRAQCGEPGAPMEMTSTIWETRSGGRYITLEYAGRVRKHLYDLDGDGVVERESWASVDSVFTTTRATRYPVPAFLVPSTAGDTAQVAEPVRSGGARPRTAPTPSLSNLPEPEVRPVQVMGQPLQPEPVPPDTGRS